MNEFLVLEDGLLTVKQAHDLAAWYGANSLTKDPLAMEANWMAIRVGNAVLEAGRPRHPVMSVARFSVLRSLFMVEGHRLSMSEISQMLAVTMTNVTKLIDGLVASNLVERIDDEGDKRKTWAQLTPDGLAFVNSLLPEVATQIEQTWSCLTTREKRLLVHLLAKLKLQIQIAGATERLDGVNTIEELF
jgi:DNA-binding MarR family transcriptional regulator